MTGEAPAAFFDFEGYRVEAWPANPDTGPQTWDAWCEGELVGEIGYDPDRGYCELDSPYHPDLRTVLAGIAWEIARERRVSSWNRDERDDRAEAQAELARSHVDLAARAPRTVRPEGA